jgi:hypothetical protein
MNLAPVFFGGFRVSRHVGLNMAYWNLHERTLVLDQDGHVTVNGVDPLVFFHFSSIDPHHPESITRIGVNRRTLEERPDLRDLVRRYAKQLLVNGQQEYSAIECAFSSMHATHVAERLAEEKALRLAQAPLSYRAFLAAKWLRLLARRAFANHVDASERKDTRASGRRSFDRR